MFLITVLTNEFTFFLYNTSEDNLSTLRSEEHTSELQSRSDLVCRLLLEKKKKASHTPVSGTPSPFGKPALSVDAVPTCHRENAGPRCRDARQPATLSLPDATHLHADSG